MLPTSPPHPITLSLGGCSACLASKPHSAQKNRRKQCASIKGRCSAQSRFSVDAACQKSKACLLKVPRFSLPSLFPKPSRLNAASCSFLTLLRRFSYLSQKQAPFSNQAFLIGIHQACRAAHFSFLSVRCVLAELGRSSVVHDSRPKQNTRYLQCGLLPHCPLRQITGVLFTYHRKGANKTKRQNRRVALGLTQAEGFTLAFASFKALPYVLDLHPSSKKS